MHMPRKKLVVFLYLLSLALLATSAGLAVALLTSGGSASDPCMDPATVRKLLPAVLGENVKMKFVFENSSVKLVLPGLTYTVATAEDGKLRVVNHDFWEVFELYCEEKVAESLKTTATLYAGAVVALASAGAVLAVVAQRAQRIS